MAVQVRQAAPTDVPAMTGLLVELGYDSDESRMRRRFERVVRQSDHAVFVAVDAPHGIVALLHVSVQATLLDRPFAEIRALVVAQNHRRQGIGRQIVEQAQWWATKRGIDDLVAGVRAKANSARMFLSNLNFRALQDQRVFHRNLSSVPPSDRTITD